LESINGKKENKIKELFWRNALSKSATTKPRHSQKKNKWLEKKPQD
jgi:hypothetical protein